MKRALLLAILLYPFLNLNSQNIISPCGVIHKHQSSKDEIDFRKFKSQKINTTYKMNGSVTCDTVLVQIYVCRNNQGQTDIDIDNFYESLETLNNQFKDINIFFSSQLNYIDDNDFVDYRVGINSDKASEYRNQQAINVYLHDFIYTANNMSVAGIATRLDYHLGGRVHLSKLSGIRTHIHEMGHAFGLLHTHGKYNFNTSECNDVQPLNGFNLDVYCQGAVQYDFDETIDLNNDSIPDCEQIGDNVCDTPSTPILTNDITNCLYVGNEVDIFGDNYNPITSNVMSYGSDINCGELFTQGQKDRMRFTFEKYGGYLNCPCNESILIENTNSFGNGSFMKAISCVYVCDTSNSIEVDESVSESIITLDQIIRIKSNTYINSSSSNESILVLDFQELQLPMVFLLEEESSNIEIKGIALLNVFNQGINIESGTENITLSNLEIQDFDNFGIIVSDNTNLNINNCTLRTVNEQSGVPIRITNSSDIILESNSILSGNSGVYLQNSSNATIIKNKIGIDEAGESYGQHLSSISIFNCNNISIGTDQVEDQNIISNSSWNGVSISQNSQNVSYQINSNYCHENSSLTISPDSNNNLNRPSITFSGSDKTIRGSGIVGATINLYKDESECVRCEGYEFLGSTIVDNNSNWEIIISDFLVHQTKIIANQIVGMNGSNYSWCHTYTCFANGNSEIVYNGIDDDCNIMTLDDDLDQDGFLLADDCDDTNAQINPFQFEITYNGLDDDCNSATLDDDLDQDGFLLADDCDDTNAQINPSQSEITYNGIDDDCNSTTLDDDLDQDGFLLVDDCDDTNAQINPSQNEITYNGIDDDCNSATLDDDLDQDGFLLVDDCDDTNAQINPSQIEITYNGIDDDCNSATLDDDLDQDGFLLSDDCDDTNSQVNPNQNEIPYNGLDDDCNGSTFDDDLDQDGYVLVDDCDDENAQINPDAIEIPNNGIDEDCDGEDLMTATHELEKTIVRIYPNPVRDVIKIDTDQILEFTIRLTNLNGQVLYKGKNISYINVHFIPSGLYILELKAKISGQRISELIFVEN